MIQNQLQKKKLKAKKTKLLSINKISAKEKTELNVQLPKAIRSKLRENNTKRRNEKSSRSTEWK